MKRKEKSTWWSKSSTFLVPLVGLFLLLTALNSTSGQLSPTMGKIANFVGNWLGEIYDRGTRIGANVMYINYLTTGKEILYENLVELITLNPPVEENILLKLFMQLMMPFYFLSITALGFYLIFYSGSPALRAKAKSILGRMVVGFFIISLTPQIWEIGLKLSEALTHQILNLVDLDVYIYLMKRYVSGSIGLFWMLGWGETWDFAFFYPLMWVWYFVWGTFGVIMLRFITVTLWIALFPLSVFFYSFEPTRDLGRNMVEQTIIWISLQVFNAVVIAAVVVGVMNIGLENDLYFIGETFPKVFDILPTNLPFADIPPLSFIGVDFMLFMSVFMMIMAPLMLTRLFRNFLPR